jgi:hypothetical protein
VLGFASVDGAERFVEDKVPALETESVKLDSEKADEKAEDTVSEGTLASLGVGLKFGGLIGFVAGFLYTALWAMRVGLLTRFWGSLGVALAAVSVFFLQFALLWFVYVALLLLGLVRGGRPPAWESGKAEPWPTPGERAAAAIEKGSAAGLPSSAEGDERQDDGSPNNGEPPRKRKQRG